MKAFNGFEAKKSASSRELLPAGGYVCTINNAKVEEYDNGFSVLVLAIEVAEGQYAGFWKKDFDNNTNELKKWRGIYRISLPKDDGSEMDAWTKRTFGNFMWAVQESNSGYVWNWDEKTLKGKKVGVIYRNREWEYNGNSGWTTEAAGSATVEEIRNNSFRPLKDKPLKNRPVQTAEAPATAAVEEDDELPF